jgi:cobalt/nickel transport system ATP-binding protein
LSYGERKRACLAGLLAYSPSIYLLDEPTANLEPRSRRQLIELIKTSATTRLIATHDLELALALCPRSIVLDAGRIVADGPTPTLLADETLMESHGLEVPLSLALARCT